MSKKLAFVTPVAERDEPFKEPFLKGIANVYPGAGITFAEGGINWPRRPDLLLEKMAEAAEKMRADWIIKADVDCLHLSADWLKPAMRKTNPPVMVGFQGPPNPATCHGHAYALRATIPRQILDHPKPLIRALSPRFGGVEDVVISMAVRLIEPNGIYLWRNADRERALTHYGWDDRAAGLAAMIEEAG